MNKLLAKIDAANANIKRYFERINDESLHLEKYLFSYAQTLYAGRFFKNGNSYIKINEIIAVMHSADYRYYDVVADMLDYYADSKQFDLYTVTNKRMSFKIHPNGDLFENDIKLIENIDIPENKIVKYMSGLFDKNGIQLEKGMRVSFVYDNKRILGDIIGFDQKSNLFNIVIVSTGENKGKHVQMAGCNMLQTNFRV